MTNTQDRTEIPLAEGISAGVGAALSCIAFYPLELIKTRLQAEIGSGSVRNGHELLQKILKKQGIGGLYVGVLPVLFRSISADSIYFYISFTITNRVRRMMNRSLNALESLVLGFISACLTQILIHPVDTICTKVVADQGEETSWWMHLKKIIKGKGITALWSGYRASMILSLNPALQFTLFERLKEELSRRMTLNAPHLFALGMITKAITLTCVYPLIRMKVRMQSDHQLEDMSSSYREILETEGPAGFYKGLSEQISKSSLSTALLLLVKEKVNEKVRIFFK